jgi:hypothetical protein
MFGVFSFVCFLRRRSLECLEYLVLFVFLRRRSHSKHTRERRLKKQTKLNTPSILVNAVLKKFSFVCFLRRRSLVCLEYLVLFLF